MKRIGIAYATRDGQTRKIAGHIADRLTARRVDVEVWNVGRKASDRRLNSFDAVILASSVLAGKHQPEMVNFVKQHLGELNALPAAFLSVSLSQAGVERPGITPEQLAMFSADVQKVLSRFFTQTNWYPKYFKAVAGALLYTQYNFLIRFIMKGISRKAGGSTDTTRDHEYTDWTELDRFTEEFTSQLMSPKTSREYCAAGLERTGSR